MTVMLASVTTNGVISNQATARPLKAPTASPETSIVATPAVIPQTGMTKAPRTAAKAMVAGMERSMPPTIITKVRPIAMTPSEDPWMRTLTRFRTEKKFGA